MLLRLQSVRSGCASLTLGSIAARYPEQVEVTIAVHVECGHASCFDSQSTKYSRESRR